MKYLKICLKEIAKSRGIAFFFVKVNLFLFLVFYACLISFTRTIDDAMLLTLEDTDWTYTKEYTEVNGVERNQIRPDRINIMAINSVLKEKSNWVDRAIGIAKHITKTTDLNFVICEKDKKMFFVNSGAVADFKDPNNGCKIQND